MYLHDASERLEADVLQAAAGYLGVAPEEIAVTGSTTMGLGLLYATLRLDAGEEILTSEHDFYSTHEALRLRAEATGASVRRVRLYDEPGSAASGDIVQRVRDAVTPSTRAVALTWVHSSTGVKLPVREIADELSERDAELGKRKTLLAVDAVHGFGVEPEALPDLGCDFLVSGCHKWLFGPRGTGIVWGRADAWPEVGPDDPLVHGRRELRGLDRRRRAERIDLGRRLHAGWLPRVRAPLGPCGRLPLPARGRARAYRRADAGPRNAAQAGPARGPGGGGEDAV